MKTKIIILTAVTAVLLYSCSTDREENVTPVIEKTKPEKFKLNQFGGSQVEESSIIVSDSIRLNSPSAAPAPPDYNQDPDDGTEIVHPGDVKPPKGGK